MFLEQRTTVVTLACPLVSAWPQPASSPGPTNKEGVKNGGSARGRVLGNAQTGGLKTSSPTSMLWSDTSGLRMDGLRRPKGATLKPNLRFCEGRG